MESENNLLTEADAERDTLTAQLCERLGSAAEGFGWWPDDKVLLIEREDDLSIVFHVGEPITPRFMAAIIEWVLTNGWNFALSGSVAEFWNDAGDVEGSSRHPDRVTRFIDAFLDALEASE